MGKSQQCEYVINGTRTLMLTTRSGTATLKPGASSAAFQWRVPSLLNDRMRMLVPTDPPSRSKCCLAEQSIHHHGPTHSSKRLRLAQECLQGNGYTMAMFNHLGRLMCFRVHQVLNQVHLQVLTHLPGERGVLGSRLPIGMMVGTLHFPVVPRLPRV